MGGIVVPAIPSTQLSGHVYGEDERPLAGCLVSAVTRESSRTRDVNVRGSQAFTYEAPQTDDPRQLMEVETEETGADGSYVLTHLGADRYFLLARCNEPKGFRTLSTQAWEPMLYAKANTIPKAREIILLPGDQRGGIDFHLKRKRSYVLQGRSVFSDGTVPEPWPKAVYLHDLYVFRSDRAFTSTWLGQEDCDWNANTGEFRCSSLLPGTYTLYFELASGLGAASHIPTQFARVSYTVRTAANQPPLTVHLHPVPDSRSFGEPVGPSGSIDLSKVCGSAAGRGAVEVLAWGKRHTRGVACYLMNSGGYTGLSVPEDVYSVTAFEKVFVQRGFHLGSQSKFEDAVMQYGTKLHIEAGRTSQISLPVLSSKELIRIGLESLRAGQ